jgi:hypothetical protein
MIGLNESLIASSAMVTSMKSGFNRSIAVSVLATSSLWCFSALMMESRSWRAAAAMSKMSRGLMVAPR